MAQRRGRQDKRVSTAWVLLEYWWAAGLLGATGLLILWHLAVVATTPAQMTDFTASLVGFKVGAPLTGIPGAGIGTVVVFILELLGLMALVFLVTLMVAKRASRTPGKGMASKADHKRSLTQEAVLAKEARLWPNDGDGVPREEITFTIGRATYGMSALDAHFGQEQHLMVLAPTGVGKTYRVTSRAALDAPGALVVTSTRPDLLDVIATSRERKGRVWVFDLLNLSSWPEPMRWNFVRGCEDSSVARARAGQIVKGGQKKISGAAGGGDSNSEFFQDNARDVLQCYLHAAALSGKHTVADIVRWGTDFETDKTAQKILRDHAYADPMLASRLNSLVTGAPETVASTRNTLDQALSSLALRRINEQFESEEGGFDPDLFARSTDTLVIIADNNDPTDVTNLAAMMLEEVLQAAKRAARRTATGRLTPPLRAVLDEVANIAPIPKFPEMLSDLRAYGIQIIFAIQSNSQARRTWGNEGAQMIVDNSAGLLILGGIKDPNALKDMSSLAGKVDVRELSTRVRDLGMKRGDQTLSEREREVLRPEEIAQLREGEALLVTGQIPPALLELPGWTERPDGQKLSAEAKATGARRERAAMEALA